LHVARGLAADPLRNRIFKLKTATYPENEAVREQGRAILP